jgi:hypothetical protein
VIRVPTSCIETVGKRPVMKSKPETAPPGCPDEMACLDKSGMAVISRWISETLRWMDQVEKACAKEE